MKWYYQQFTEADERHMNIFYERAYWKQIFLWKPKQCNLTGKWLWLRRAWMGTAYYLGPGETIFEFRYHENKNHLIWSLSR